MAIAAIGFVAAHLVAFLLLASTCYAVGRLCVGRAVFDSAAADVAVSVVIGFGAVGEALFLLGLARLLYWWLVVLLVVFVHVAARRRLEEGLQRLRQAWRSSPPAVRWATVPGAVACLLAFVLALFPPTAFDATLYHFPYAATFAREHAVVFIDSLRYPVFAQLNDMLFTAMLLVYDDVAAQMVELVALFGTALVLFEWGRRWQRSRAGLWAAALWLGNPIAVYLGGTGYIDAGLAMFVLAALLFWATWQERGETHWLILSAAAAGFAAGTKYHGLFFIGALSVATAGWCLVKRRWAALPLFVLTASILAAPFYVRNAAETGNPVFPFLSGVFGQSEWKSGLDRHIESSGGLLPAMISRRAEKVLEDPERSATYLWRLSVDRKTLMGHPPYSPFYLLLLPAILWAAVARPQLRVAAAVAFAYALVVAGRDPRFLLPAAAVFALCASIELDQLIPRRHTAALLAALVLLAPGLAWSGREIWRRGPVPVTPATRERYLTQRIPGYPMVELLDRTHGRSYTVYALGMENARYFAEGRFLGDHTGPYSYARIAGLRGSRAVYGELRRMGAGYFLVRTGEKNRLADGSFPALFRLVESSEGVELYRLAN